MRLNAIYHFLFGTLRGRLIVGVALVHAVMMALFIADLTARQRAMLIDYQTEHSTALSYTFGHLRRRLDCGRRHCWYAGAGG